jgi:hypothetical protein
MVLNPPQIKMAGKYSAIVLDSSGKVKDYINPEKTLKSGQLFDNDLLDSFFDRVNSIGSPVNNGTLKLGTGTTPVNNSQSNLVNPITLQSGNWPSPSAVSQPNAVVVDNKVVATFTMTFTFNVGQVVGNISEMGIDFAAQATASNSVVQSRALVVDGSGNPTTIPVLVTEQLIVNYAITAEIDVADHVETVSLLINGVSQPTEVTVRHKTLRPLPAYLSLGSWYAYNNSGAPAAHSGAFNAAFTGPSTIIGYSSDGVPQFNTGGGKQATYLYPADSSNAAGGITAISENWAPFKYGFNPPIPKNADRQFSITIKHTFGRLD